MIIAKFYTFILENENFWNVICLFSILQPVMVSNLGSLRRCRALYDCEADNEDELSFREGDVIIIINEQTDDDNWMEGVLERAPDRSGMFPISFVHVLQD